MLRFYIDGTQYDPPENWQELVLRRDIQDKFIVETLEGDVAFYGDAFRYLYGKLIDNVCDTVECDVFANDGEGSMKLFHRGKIFIPEIRFELGKGKATCTISDNSFLAKIRNSQSLKFAIGVGRSISDITYTGATAVDVEMHTPSTGVALGSTREMFRYFDAIEDLISAVTDDEVTTASTLLESGGGGYDWMLTSGDEIRTARGGVVVRTSIEDILSELDKWANIICYVTDNNLNPVFHVEHYADQFSTTEALAVMGIRDSVRGADAAKLYSSIRGGSTQTRRPTQDTPNTSAPQLVLACWEDDTINLSNTCSSGAVLNLTNREYVIDSNSVENQLNGDDDQDDKVFVIETYDDSGTQKTTQYPLNAQLYNQAFCNEAKANAWADQLIGEVFVYASTGGDLFRAEKTATQNLSGVSANNVISFPTEISDPGANYDNVLFKYTAPTAGWYNFRVGFLKVTNNNVRVPAGGVVTDARIYARHYDTSPAVVDEKQIVRLKCNQPFNQTFNAGTSIFGWTIFSNYHQNAGFYLAASETVQVEIDVLEANADVTVEITGGDLDGDPSGTAYFECIATATDDGIIIAGTGERLQTLSFEKALSYADYVALRDEPLGYVGAGVYNHYLRKEETILGHRSVFTYNPTTGNGQFELLLP